MYSLEPGPFLKENTYIFKATMGYWGDLIDSYDHLATAYPFTFSVTF